jgi:hypothetical protein
MSRWLQWALLLAGVALLVLYAVALVYDRLT